MQKLILITTGLLILSSCGLFGTGRKGTSSFGVNSSGVLCGTTVCAQGQICYELNGVDGCYTTSTSCGSTCDPASFYCLIINDTPSCVPIVVNDDGDDDVIAVPGPINNWPHFTLDAVVLDHWQPFYALLDPGFQALLNYGDTFTSSPAECKSGVEQGADNGKCGCKINVDDPCTNGYICKNAQCQEPGLQLQAWAPHVVYSYNYGESSNHGLQTVVDIEEAPYGFSDIRVIDGSSYSIACDNGYLKIPVDLNRNAGAKYVFLCVKYADKGDTAVNEIKFAVTPPLPGCLDPVPAPIMPGWTPMVQKLVPLIVPNLNSGKSCKKHIFGYYKKGTSPSIMKRLRINGRNDASAWTCRCWTDNCAGWDTHTTINFFSGVAADLNEDIGGDYIYMCYK
ncbi:MAG: hypothetical protein V1647_06515 [Pseudomonadota bacterium]